MWRIAPGKHLVAAFYRNTAIHVFVDRAIGEVALLAAAESEDGELAAVAEAEALRLRELLKFDFFFAGRHEFGADIDAELRGAAGAVGRDRSEDAAEMRARIAVEQPHVAHLVLRPFLDAYHIVADRLAALDVAYEEEAFLHECIAVGQQWALQGRITSDESVTLELFQHGPAPGRPPGTARLRTPRPAEQAPRLRRGDRGGHGADRDRSPSSTGLDAREPRRPHRRDRGGPAGPAHRRRSSTWTARWSTGSPRPTCSRTRSASGQVGAGDLARLVLTAVDGTLGGDPTRAGGLGISALRGHCDGPAGGAGRAALRAEDRRHHPPAVARHRQGTPADGAHRRPRLGGDPVPDRTGRARASASTTSLCTELETEDGVLTGRVIGAFLWGEPKARAVRRFAREHGIDLPQSYGYANGDEDVAVPGQHRPARMRSAPGRALRRRPTCRAGRSSTCRSRSGQDCARLLGHRGAVAGLNAGLLGGAVIGAVRRDKRSGINLGIPTGCDAALALAGVKLEVTGEKNLLERPAIFIGNHQSSLDPVIMGALLRRDITGVAKAEASRDPRMLLATLLLDPVFIDRSNSTQSRAALDALRDRMRSGTSIMIFPEGTRMPTPEPGPFKKGAFHMAMQVGVPIVPVVFRNAGDLLAPHSLVVRPGTVEVCVLEPIDTSDWTRRGPQRHRLRRAPEVRRHPGEVAGMTGQDQMWDLAASWGARGPDERDRGTDVALRAPPAALLDDLLADDPRPGARLGPLPGGARVGDTELVPRCRQRVLDPLLPVGPPAWVTDEAFRLELPRTPHPPARSRHDGAAAGARPDPGAHALRPQPAAVGGHPGRGARGRPGGVPPQAAPLAHRRARRHPADVARPEPRRASTPPTSRPPSRASRRYPTDRWGLTTAVVREQLAAAARAVVCSRRSLGARALTGRGAAVSDAVRYASSLRRTLAAPPAPPSPLLAGRRGTSWRFEVLECPLADLKAAAKSAHGSLNDAYVAALLGGLRRYHELHGVGSTTSRW